MDRKKGFFLKLKGSFLIFTSLLCMQSSPLSAEQTFVELENKELCRWIDEVQKLCKPERVHICDGSQEEYDLLTDQMVEN